MTLCYVSVPVTAEGCICHESAAVYVMRNKEEYTYVAALQLHVQRLQTVWSSNATEGNKSSATLQVSRFFVCNPLGERNYHLI
jgi:hypothetical protein